MQRCRQSSLLLLLLRPILLLLGLVLLVLLGCCWYYYCRLCCCRGYFRHSTKWCPISLHERHAFVALLQPGGTFGTMGMLDTLANLHLPDPGPKRTASIEGTSEPSFPRQRASSFHCLSSSFATVGPLILCLRLLSLATRLTRDPSLMV